MTDPYLSVVRILARHGGMPRDHDDDACEDQQEAERDRAADVRAYWRDAGAQGRGR